MSSTTVSSVGNALQTNDDDEKSRLNRINGYIAEQNKIDSKSEKGKTGQSTWRCTKWQMLRIKSQRWNRSGRHRWFMNHCDKWHESTYKPYISTPSHKKASYLHAHKKIYFKMTPLDFEWISMITFNSQSDRPKHTQKKVDTLIFVTWREETRFNAIKWFIDFFLVYFYININIIL